MYVPVVVISVVLFASAVSTHTSNNNGSVSVVDQASEVHLEEPSSIETLQNGTDHSVVMSNKTSHSVDHIQVSTKTPIQRPSDACTQSKGVRSTCLQSGKRIRDDKLVVKKRIKKIGKANSEQLEAFSYVVKPSLVKKGFVISHIKVTNKMKVGTEGLVSIVRGGTLETEVVLVMESQQGRRMNFLIEIYVGPVATAYKELLGSLISNLKSL